MNRPFIHKAFEPRRTATWNIRLGFYHGQGQSSVEIAKLLGDGTGPETVRSMIQGADLPSAGRRRVFIPINMESWERDILQRHAHERGVDMQTLIYRMVASGLVLDDLYDAVTDGRYS